MSARVVVLLSLLFCIVQINAWNFYDLTFTPPKQIDLTQTVKNTKDTLFANKGTFQGVTLGDLSTIQSKIVVARTAENPHIHHNDVFNVVFEGAGTMNTPIRAMFAGSGDAYVVPVDTLHFTVNHRNVTTDPIYDENRDYIVFLASFSPQPYSRVAQETTLQPTPTPAGLSTNFQIGKFASIEGAANDVDMNAFNGFKKTLITTETSSATLIKLDSDYSIFQSHDSLIVLMDGSAELHANGVVIPLSTKDFFMIPKNTVGTIVPTSSNVRIIINTSPSSPPTCVASVSLVSRPTSSSWVANGQNFKIYDVQVNNIGSEKIKTLNIQVNTGGATFNQKWNLNEVNNNNNLFSFPDYYQYTAFPIGGEARDAGFILQSAGAINPSVLVSSISC